MAKTILHVEGMSCGHCKSAVEGVLTRMEGVEKAEVRLEEHQVIVEYDATKTDESRMKEAVEAQGYDVK